MIPVVLVAALGAIPLVLVSRRVAAFEARGMAASLLFHYVAALAQVSITSRVYGGGDMLLYHELGGLIAQWITYDPASAWPETLGLLLGRSDAWFPFDVLAPGDATGTMVAVGGIARLFFGDSLEATCVLLATLSFYGKCALYFFFRRRLLETRAQSLLLACLMVPSTVFWTSGLLKEAIAMAGLGFAVWGADAGITQRRATGILAAIIGAKMVAVSKPYLLIPLALAGGLLIYGSRRARDIPIVTPGRLVLGSIVGVVGLVVVAKVFPQYGLDQAVERTAYLQEIGASVGGGSNYTLGFGSASVASQLVMAPVALATALFRPSLFEVTNAPMALSAVETTAVLVLVGRVVVRTGIRGAFAQIVRDPTLLACCAFVLVMGVAVGLASTNLGTLSRYRAPMLPFLGVVVVALMSRANERRSYVGGDVTAAPATSRK